MDTFAFHLIKSFVASGVLYFYYQLALRDNKCHSYNRCYLLLSLIASLVIPFVNFTWLYIEGSENIFPGNLVDNINSPATRISVHSSSIGPLLIGIGACISVVFLTLLASKIRWILRIKRMNAKTKMKGFTLIETAVKEAPFSFLNNLFWKQGLSMTDINGERILKHELTHITQKHTYDKLFAQIVSCICWINPFYWLIQTELNTVHEFIADAASIEDGDAESFAKMLLYAHNEGSYLSPSHPFFNSSIKRRLIMINLSNKARSSRLKRILAFPIVLFVLAISSASLKPKTTPRTDFIPAQSGHLITAPDARKTAEDTIPKSAAPSNRNSNPITVVGYKSERKSDSEPITVVGHKADPKPGQEPITVIGHKSAQKPGLEPITVTGRKSQ